MKRLFITTSFIILFSCCALSQEQNESVGVEISKERGYHFGLTFDYNLLRTNQLVLERIDWVNQYDHMISIPILNYNSFFVKGTYLPVYVALTSLHNLNKDWDIGFKIGFLTTNDETSFGATSKISSQSRLWTSLLIATYGYYYPFENRYFIKFGLENNIYIRPEFFGPEYEPKLASPYGPVYYDKRNFRTSFSLGLGYNYNNTCLLNIGISIPFYNVYGYQDYLTPRELLFIHHPVKLYYTLSAGFTFLFI